MSRIGNLFYKLFIDDKGLVQDAKKAGAQAGTGFGAQMTASIRKSWSGKEMGKGLVQGLGLAGGLGAAALFTTAISKIVDVLGDATQAALAEEVSIQKLGTALKANIPNWDGNTAAIEEVIKSRMRLGFSDDEQRESMALLVVATNDVSKALDIQRTAMDLARLKGISLADASAALIKVEGGQFRALKALGIQLKAGATQTEALAAVQKAAAGQAEDYAETNAGKLLVSQVKVGEQLEKLGAITLPIVVAGTTAAADVAEDLAGTLDGLTGTINAVTEAFGGPTGGGAVGGTFDLIHAAQELMAVTNPSKISNTLGFMLDIIDKIGINTAPARHQLEGMGFDVAKVADKSTTTAERIKGAMGSIGTSLDTAGDDAEEWRDRFTDSSGAIIRSANRVRAKLAETAQFLIDEYFNPLETRAALHDTRLELFANEETLRTAKGREEKRQAAANIVASLDSEASALVDLGAQGALTAKDVERFTKDVKRQYGSMSKEARAKIDAIIARLRALAGMSPVNMRVNVQQRGPIGGNWQEFAEGGTVQGPAGSPQLVLAHGGEHVLSLPEVRAARATGALSMAGAVSTIGGTTVNLTMPVQRASDPFETATQLRRLADFGVLSPPPRFDR